MTGPDITRGPRLRRFARHYLEMAVAMVAGMVVLGPLESALFDPVGWADLRARPELHAMIMATNMTLAMVVWMRVRGHRWMPIAEMSAVMYLAFAVLFLPFRWGALTGQELMLWGHALMFTGMALVMLLRPVEYAGHHHTHPRPEESS